MPPKKEEIEKSMSKSKPKTQSDAITVRFAGDSGDGMQLAGDQFTDTTAIMGNDFATFPDFPAEMRRVLRRWSHAISQNGLSFRKGHAWQI